VVAVTILHAVEMNTVDAVGRDHEGKELAVGLGRMSQDVELIDPALISCRRGTVFGPSAVSEL